MNDTRPRIHWAWLPAAIFFEVMLWARYGAFVAVLAGLGGLALGLYVEHRARKRRDRSNDL